MQTPDEIRDLILRSCNGKGLQALLDKTKASNEQVVDLNSKAVSLEGDISKLQQQIDDLRRQALDSGVNPEVAAKKINSLKKQIDEAAELKNLVEAQIEKITIEQQGISDQILDIVRSALRMCKTKIIGEMTDELIKITNTPKNWNDGVGLLGKIIPGWAKVSTDLRFMSFLGERPIDVIIN